MLNLFQNVANIANAANALTDKEKVKSNLIREGLSDYDKEKVQKSISDSFKQKIIIAIATFVSIVLVLFMMFPLSLFEAIDVTSDTYMMITFLIVFLILFFFFVGLIIIYKTTGQPYCVYSKFVLNSNPEDVPIIKWNNNKLIIENMPKIKAFKSKKEVVIVIVAIIISLFMFRNEIAEIGDDIQSSIATYQRQQQIDNAKDKLDQINENLESLENK